jgi:ribosomal protein S26
MAAKVQCDVCGKVFPYNKIKHIRMHNLTDATTYKNTTIEYFDLCEDCYNKSKALLKQEAKE